MRHLTRGGMTTAAEVSGFALIAAAAWVTGVALGLLVTGLALVILGTLVGRA